MATMQVRKKVSAFPNTVVLPYSRKCIGLGVRISPNGYGAEAFGRVICTNRWSNWAGDK